MSTVFDGIEHNLCAILAAGMNRFPDTGPVTFIHIRKQDRRILPLATIEAAEMIKGVPG